MKNLFLLLFLLAGSIALASTTEQNVKQSNEKSASTIVTVTEEASIINDTVKSEKQQASITNKLSGSNNPRFNISVFIADFINRNNLKIVKCLLKE